ncbi:hypothetical protein [Paenibacillus sp. HB172176]|uniref:hypothetical protein n=1 Tax=Paenibacillus sp. HB172176 TaxID=2493690 RepID=UPI00143A8A21|nr:hypothetical protein [Paenibacillus sp. HB172176]
MKGRKTVLNLVLLAMVFLFSVSTSTVSAENSNMNTSQLVSQFANDQSIFVENITVETENGIAINVPSTPTFSVMSNYNLTNDLLNYNDSLTTTDPSDFYFFSVPDPRNIIFRVQSSNPDYRVELYEIDWSTSTAYPTGLGNSSGNDSFSNGLYAADWGLLVTSTGTVGATYTIQMNAASPGGATSLLSSSSALQSVVWGYSNNDLYLNEDYITNTTDAANTNPHLDWERHFYLSSGGDYQARDHEVSDARVSYITTRVNYSSDYASSNNAVLIILKSGTLFSYSESQFQSGPPTNYYQSFLDTTGRTTPRRLDAIDMAGDPDILVYDLNTNQVIDFISNLNYYYAMGIESSPSVTYYN